METILIQKGNSINRDLPLWTNPGSVASKQTRSETRLRFFKADKMSASKIFTHLLQPDWFTKHAVGPVAQQGKQSQYSSEIGGITRHFH
jgi:hypothetical protein